MNLNWTIEKKKLCAEFTIGSGEYARTGRAEVYPTPNTDWWETDITEPDVEGSSGFYAGATDFPTAVKALAWCERAAELLKTLYELAETPEFS